MENQNQKYSRAQSFLWVVVAYVIGLGFAIFVGKYFLEIEQNIRESIEPIINYQNVELWSIFWADIAYTLVVFGFAYWFKNSSFYDPYWSVIPILITIYFVFFYWQYTDLTWYSDIFHHDIITTSHWRIIIVSFLVTLWGVRLTWNWARGWSGIHHEDWRYIDLQKQHSKRYWLVSLSGIMLFPTILVFLGCLPIWVVIVFGIYSFGTLDILAIIVTLTGIAFEFFADNQLRNFVLTNKEKEKPLTTGLWKYSRHPNYFGEVTFWWGIFLFGLAANPSYWWTVIGAVSMTALFHFISIPMIEKRHLERKKNYAEVVARVSRWFPWFPKK